MAVILKQQEDIYIKKYIIIFYVLEEDKSYQFDCNQFGVVDSTRLKIDDYNNYKKCISNKYTVTKSSVRLYNKQYKTHIHIQCDCLNEFYLSKPVNYCSNCGRGFYQNGTKVDTSNSVKVTFMKKID